MHLASLRRGSVWVGLLMLAGLVIAWRERFIQDDAFISFNYARSLVEGNGLTWFGTRVEGYTNFLWVLWNALGMRLGAEPMHWSWLGGIASFLFAMIAIVKISRAAFGEMRIRVLALILFATNFTMSAYATGGLETMLQAALLALAMGQLYEMRGSEERSGRQLPVLSLILTFAILTRLDSALPAAVIGFFAVLRARRLRVSAGSLGVAVAIPLVLLGSWAAWKLAYYGSLLPNTFYAKAPGGSIGVDGLRYLWRFFHWYMLWPFLALGLISLVVRPKPGGLDLKPIVTVVLTWMAYVVWVGGDFMEFRFLVPIGPFIFILLAWLILEPIGARLIRRPRITAVVAAAAIIGLSVHHGRSFRTVSDDRTLDSIPALATFYGVYPKYDWSRIGVVLRRDLASSETVIATHAVGAIPFYSRLKTIDIYGLNDPEVARHGARLPKEWRKPGHQVHATLQYLRDQKVNLILMHPKVISRGAVSNPQSTEFWRRIFLSWEPPLGEKLGDVTVLGIPLGQRYAVLGWYLVPNPRIDELIQSRAWESQIVRVHP